MPKKNTLTRADYLSDYKIALTFGDGKQDIIDFEVFIQKAQNPMTTKYRELSLFRQFEIQHADLVWNDYEMCFSGEDLYNRANLDLVVLPDALLISKYILKIAKKFGDQLSLTNLKLQKLLYYAQAHHLARYDSLLFANQLFAWKHGPVVPSVYYQFKSNKDRPIPTPRIQIKNDSTFVFLEKLYEEYGKYTAWALRDKTHEESPFKNTKQGKRIELMEMRDYFRNITALR